jgi:hypothetical protein
MPPVVGTTLSADAPLTCLSTVIQLSIRWLLTVSVARRNAASDVASTSARSATVATPWASVLTVAILEKVVDVAVLASVAPIVNASKRTARLASAAPALSLSVTEAVPASLAHRVATELAGLLTGAQVDPVAAAIFINGAEMVAGVTVTVTVDVAAAVSVTVNVTGVSFATLLAEKVNDAPMTSATTGNTVGLLDTTLNGPLPPVTLTVLGAPPNAIKLAGSAASVVDVTGGVLDELEPPQPESVSATATVDALSTQKPKLV